jgi:thiol-disulfide isomerase/thioredoxin
MIKVHIFILVTIVSFFSTARTVEHSDVSAAGTPVIEISGSLPTVQLLTASGLRDIIRHRNGKVLVLNIWATWCLPCMEEFPSLMRITDTYDTNKVEVVGISIDYADEIPSKVIPFLKKNKIPFRMYLAQFSSQEQFINSLKRSWNGAIPATFIYDRNGRQKIALIGEQSFEQFQSSIDKILQAH